MAKAGEVFENPVTGERAVMRLGTEDTGRDQVVVDLYAKPGGTVAREHVHPVIEESFTVVHRQVGFRISGHESIAKVNRRLHVPAGVAHRLVECGRGRGAYHSRDKPWSSEV